MSVTRTRVLAAAFATLLVLQPVGGVYGAGAAGAAQDDREGGVVDVLGDALEAGTDLGASGRVGGGPPDGERRRRTTSTSTATTTPNGGTDDDNETTDGGGSTAGTATPSTPAPDSPGADDDNETADDGSTTDDGDSTRVGTSDTSGGTVETSSTTDADRYRFLVKQDGTSVIVTPLTGPDPIVEFYDYYDAEVHTNNGLEESDRSLTFFWLGPNGELSLVTIHDKGDDGSGAAVSFDITGLPTSQGSWTVKDDSGDFNTATDIDWAWSDENTDGGAFTGGLKDDDVSISIDPAFNERAEKDPLTPGRIDSWQFLSGNLSSPTRTSLDMNETLTITAINQTPVAAFGVSTTTPEADSLTRFDATDSFAPNASNEDFRWTFGDGSTATGREVAHRYTAPGDYNVTLTIDSPSGTATVTRTVTVENASAEGVEITDVNVTPSGPGIAGFPLVKRIGVETTAESPVTEVRFTVANETFVDDDGADGWLVAYDMARLERSRTMRITAVTENGTTTTETVRLAVLQPPGWMDTLAELLGVASSQGTITIGGAFPAQDGVNFDATPPGFVPVVGGEKTEVNNGQLAFEVVYDPSERAAELRGGVNGDVSTLGQQARLKLRITGTVGTSPFELRSAGVKAEIEVEIPVYMTKFGIPKVGQIDVTVNVIPTGGFDATFRTAEDGSLQSNATVSPGVRAGPTASTSVGPYEVSATGLIGIKGQVDVLPNVGDPSATATGELRVNLTGLVFERQLTYKVSEQLVGSSSRFTRTGGTDWHVADKRGRVALAPDEPDRGRIGRATASRIVPEALETNGTQEYFRLTADRVADKAPALATTDGGNGTLVVWERQPPAAPVTAGHELYWARRTDDGWSAPVRLTDDDRFDTRPSLAADGTRVTAAWTTVTADLSNDSYDAPSDAFSTMEIAVKTRTNGSWGSTRLVTDDATMDYDATIVDAAVGRVVVWQRDGDGNLSTTADREVWYVRLGENATGPQKLADGRNPAVAVTDDGDVGVAYVRSTGPDANATEIALARVTTDGTSMERTYATRAVRDVALSATTVTWATRTNRSEPSRVRFARRNATGWTAAERLAFPNATVGITELRLLDRPDRESAVLVFRGTDAATRSRVVRYRLRAGDRWLASQPLVETDSLDVVFSQLGVAGDSDSFTVAAVGRNISTDQRHDLFAVPHAYSADLAVTASLADGRAGVGERTTLSYTVENRGEVPADEPLSVVVSNGTTVLNETEFDGLGVGERLTRRVNVTVDRTGAFSVEVLAENTTELTTANNRDSVVAARPDLAVATPSQSRNGTNLTVTARLRNPTNVTATNVAYAFTAGNETLATGRLDRLTGGETRQVSVTVPAAAVNETRSVTVLADPANATTERLETNNRVSTRVLLPDVAVIAGTATVYDTAFGRYLSVLVENRGTGTSAVTLAVSRPGGNVTADALAEDELLGERTVTVPGRRQVNGSAYRRVAVPLSGVKINETLEVGLTTDRADLRPENNVGTLNVTLERRSITADVTFSATPGEPVVGRNVTLTASTTVPDVLVERVEWDLNNDSVVDRTGRQVVTGYGAAKEYDVTVTVTTVNGRTLNVTRTVVVRPSSGFIIGETDTVTVAQANRSQWHHIEFDVRHPNPVVVMRPASSNGSDPVHVRVRNVTETGFEFQLEEWAYLDGGHGLERVTYLVVEAGNYTLDSGIRLTAGVTETNASYRNVSYATPFDRNPVVITQTQTDREAQPVVTRQENGSVGGFAVALEEEEAADGNHTAERVGYVAITPGIGNNYGLPFEVAHTGTSVDEYDYRIDYAREYGQPPGVIAAIETTEGGDTAHLRYSSLSEASVEVRVEEEASADSEDGHSEERVGWVLFRNPDFLYTTDPSDVDETSTPTPPALVGDRRPTDPDGDGRYEDLNGNGRVDFDDVIEFLEHLGDPRVTDNVAAYDFNENGRVDFQDIVRLFRAL